MSGSKSEKSRRPFLILLLALEVFAGVNAAFIFRILETSMAGLVAGTVFTMVGFVALWVFVFKISRWKLASVGISAIYLLLFALPLWVTRLATPGGVPLERVLGFPLAIFHRGSELSFSFLVAITLWQLVLNLRSGRVSPPSSDDATVV